MEENEDSCAKKKVVAIASWDMASWVISNIWDAFTLQESFWLPMNRNLTWADVQTVKTPGGYKPMGKYFIHVFAIAVLFLIARFLVSRLITIPIGRYFQVNDRVVPPPVRNEVGERLFKKSKGCPSEAHVRELMEVTNWSERKVERWFRQRRLSGLPRKMDKFTDSAWRFIGYMSLLIFGMFVIPSKDYFSDLRQCWTDFPRRDIPADEFVYYLMEMAFYLSMTISHFFEQRKKDFWEMLIHHIATLGLISLSFYSNFTPIGALIMFCHDIADPWLELAKVRRIYVLF